MYDAESYINYRRNMLAAYASARSARAQEVNRIGRIVKDYLTNIRSSKRRAA